MLLEFILILAYSIYGGDKITEKCLDKLDNNLYPREINIKFLEQKRKIKKPQEATAAHTEERKEQNWQKKTGRR